MADNTSTKLSSQTAERREQLTTTGAAAFLGLSRSTLIRLEQRGYVDAWRTPGGHRRFDIEKLTALRAKLQESDAQNQASPLCIIEIGDSDG